MFTSLEKITIVANDTRPESFCEYWLLDSLQLALFISDEAISVSTIICITNCFIHALQTYHICVTFGYVSARGQSI